MRSRRVGLLGAGLLAGAVLSGCAAAETPTQPAAVTEPVEQPAAPAAATDEPSGGGSDLGAGLLPAEAFGEGTDVDTFSLDDLPDPDSWDHWGDHAENVMPPECATALDQVAAQFTDVADAAGEMARTDHVRSFEVLAVPATPVDAVEQMQTVVDACGSATFSHDDGDEDHGNAQVAIAPLPDVPEGMAAFSLTFSGTWPGGDWSATSFMGVAQDGQRVLALAQMSWDDDEAALDPASFTALLRQAYDVQAGALD